MIDETALCEKIRELYPDIGACGIDVKTHFDKTNNTWKVHLKKVVRRWTLIWKRATPKNACAAKNAWDWESKSPSCAATSNESLRTDDPVSQRQNAGVLHY